MQDICSVDCYTLGHSSTRGYFDHLAIKAIGVWKELEMEVRRRITGIVSTFFSLEAVGNAVPL